MTSMLPTKTIPAWIVLAMVLLTLIPLETQAQESIPEVQNFIKAQQARMDELAKVIEEQKRLIQDQSTVLEEQARQLQRLPDSRNIESPANPKPTGLSGEIRFPMPTEGTPTLEGELNPELVTVKRQVKDNGMMAIWGKDGRLTFESQDKSFKARLGGLFQFDIGFYSVDPYVQRLLESPGLEQGSDFRRARLRSDGICYDYMEWVFEMDFSRASDLRKDVLTAPVPNVYMNNVYVGLRDMPLLGTIRVGHIKEELSFYCTSSGRNIPFMERPNIWDALEDPYIFDNGITISRTYLDDSLYSWIGLFETNTRTGAFGVNGTAALAFDMRLCMMPIYEEEGQHWMNIGATGSIRANPNELDGPNKGLAVGQITVAPLVRAGSSFQVPNLINTGAFYPREGTQLYTLCFNYANGPLSIGAQYDGQFFSNSYLNGLPNSDGTLPSGVKPLGNLYFDGFSTEILCFLTHGDHRGVNKMDPSFLQIIPNENFSFGKRGKGIGAWEIGAKYDLVRSQFDVPGESSPRGGYLSSATLGLNWFLNPNAMVMTNYVYTTGLFGPKGPENGAFHSFGTRFQFTF